MRIVLLALVIGLGVGAWYYTPDVDKPEVILKVVKTNYINSILNINKIDELAYQTNEPLWQLELLTVAGYSQELLNIDMRNVIMTELGVSSLTTIDPCGDGAGYDVHFFRTPDNMVIYYDRIEGAFMKAIEGVYETRDNQSCLVTITRQGLVCSGATCD